jgi:hypothetical protein
MTYKQEAVGSNPASPTTRNLEKPCKQRLCGVFHFLQKAVKRHQKAVFRYKNMVKNMVKSTFQNMEKRK